MPFPLNSQADPARLGSSVGFKRSIGTASLLQKKLQGTRHYLDGRTRALPQQVLKDPTSSMGLFCGFRPSTKTDAVRKYLICLLLRRKERRPKGNKILITLFLRNSERGSFTSQLHLGFYNKIHVQIIKRVHRQQLHVLSSERKLSTGVVKDSNIIKLESEVKKGKEYHPFETESCSFTRCLKTCGYQKVISTRRIFNKKCTESKTYEVECIKSFHMESLRYETKKCFTKKAVTFRGQSEVCRLTLEVQGGSNISPKKPKASALCTDLNRQGTRAALLASFRGGVSCSSYTTQQERRLWGGSSDLRTPPVV
ncbi:hypothetical protein MJG53_009690 [Ovis ammon polii x Ovis aries]|uniref:Uncharacterized protein n=1 Tax=Ovis ammon polii x Ovis aries TaxID=2918886 RepID=A0ACB9UYA3_9CETA|nr:hypothetical protein MJG53_009690 [Ovis ammon polii x Ovis aries]